MFTGIIDHCGTIHAITKHTNSSTAVIACNFTDLTEGESIAVDGICLTAIAPEKGYFSCDISAETLQHTTAKFFAAGNQVNLERALRVGDRLGGHWVTGHVDQTALIKAIIPHDEYMLFQVTNLAPEAKNYLIKKGSIALNGVSLTLNAVTADGFELMLIPHTLQRTNLGNLRPDSNVNLEYDWLAKVVCNQVKQLEISAK